MKKLFTLGIFLAMIIGIGSNVNADIIKSAGTGITGLDWTNTAAWALGVVPTATDSVQIVSGDSVVISTEVGCASKLQVDGTLLVSNKLHVNGLVLVNSTGTLDVNASVSLYCLNITNKGRLWAKGYTISGTPRMVYLGVGFTVSGTTYTVTYPTGGDYTIVNDGRFGDFRIRGFANSVYGSGIGIAYNTLANSYTIQPSPSSTTYPVFNISQILPLVVSGQNPSTNLTLNIKESIGLGKYSTNACFSLQNGDAFSGIRTCNIFANDTVFINGNFHARGSAPSASQGSMTYNVNGCLDFSSGAISNSSNSMDLYTSATSSSVSVNVNNGGSLILGKAVKLIASAATGQSISINPAVGSTVKFGFPTGLTTATPVTLTNVSLPISLDNTTILNTNGVSLSLTGAAAQTIVGGSTSVAALTINNTSTTGVSLSSSLNVTGALTLTTATAGKLSLGNSNLTVGSIVGATSTSYVVTDGTGKLTVPAAATVATLIPVGASATSYDPVSVTPTTTSNFSVKASATLSGSPVYGVRYNAKEWDITPATASSTLIALTPSNLVESVTSPVIGHYVSGSYVDVLATMTNTNTTFTATFDTFSPFVTGANITTTALNNQSKSDLFVSTSNKSVIIKNAKAGDVVTVYSVNGVKIASSVMNSDNTTMPLSTGIYMVKVGAKTTKIAVL